MRQDVRVTQQYVCKIHSRRHIKLCAIEGGYLREVNVDEGQFVKKGQPLFRILSTLYKAKLDADIAEANLVKVEYDNTRKLLDQQIVSDQELKLAQARLDKAQARVNLSQAELDFTEIKAPFDGIVDRLHEQEGSLVEEGAMLTTMSDNVVMWAYFNVPETQYLEYQTAVRNNADNGRFDIQLRLANHAIFDYPGEINAIEADFDSNTGNIAFRADFPNPDSLLRHGQTGTILLHQILPNVIVIPQRATFEVLARQYVLVIDEDDVVHQREIIIQDEEDDIFVIENGLTGNEKIVLEGIRQVRDGETIAYEYCDPESVLRDLKFHAE